MEETFFKLMMQYRLVETRYQGWSKERL